MMDEVKVDNNLVAVFEIFFWVFVVFSFIVSWQYSILAACFWIIQYAYHINIKLNILLQKDK